MSGVMVRIGYFRHPESSDGSAGAGRTGLPLWWGTLVMAIGAISALLGVLYALAEQDIKRLLAWYRRKRRHYFAGGRWRWTVCHCTTRCSPYGTTARRTVSSAQPCAVQRAAISRRGCDYFAFAYPTTWKKWGHWRNGCRGQPQHA
ncbi:proton-conducting transporter membrane subunit [Escherichia coli]